MFKIYCGSDRPRFGDIVGVGIDGINVPDQYTGKVFIGDITRNHLISHMNFIVRIHKL